MLKTALDKLTIGTVNFGMPYGVVPGSGQVSPEQAAEIVALALEKGIDRFDTAIGYGTAEDVMGKALARAAATDAKIVTKILPLSDGTLDKEAADGIVEQIRQARDRLGVEKLDGVLVHRVADLVGPEGPRLWDVLQQARADGFTRRVGVSVYDASDIDAVLARFVPEVVQLPVSVADQRLIHSGYLQKLADKGVEIHARSVFLQGVLLADLDAVDADFSKAAVEIAALDAVAQSKGIGRLALCLAFVAQLPQVSQIVVGVNSKDQLHAIAEAASRPVAIDVAESDRCFWHDERLLNPSCWPEMKEAASSEA